VISNALEVDTPRGGRLDLDLLRQLDAPSPPRIGQTYTLDAYARYGPPRLVDVAVPFLSPATASIPLPPLGTVGIDPTRWLALPPFIIPQPAGVGSVDVAVPNVPALAGNPVYGQALLAHHPVQTRLTNVTADVLIQ
jgi:hypothetical protein